MSNGGITCLYHEHVSRVKETDGLEHVTDGIPTLNLCGQVGDDRYPRSLRKDRNFLTMACI
jgi:hypothetical protein